MAEINGAFVELYFESSVLPDSYQKLPAQRALELGNVRAEIDISSKDQPEQKTLSGRTTLEFSLECLYQHYGSLGVGTTYRDVRDAFFNGTKITVRVYENSQPDGLGVATAIWQGDSTILDFSESFPDQEGATVTVRGKVDGWAIPVPADP